MRVPRVAHVRLTRQGTIPGRSRPPPNSAGIALALAVRMPSTAWLRSSVRVALPFAWMSLAACGGQVESVHPTPAPDGNTATSTPAPDGSAATSTSGTPASTSACRSATDCPSTPYVSAICSGPISPASLCARFPSCSSDSDCSRDGDVCSTGPGAQAEGGDGGPACRPPCTSNDDCNYWEACQPDGKCQALSCDQCPSYLACTQGACGPKACGQDSECLGGYCVDGTCFATLGTCVPGCG